MNKEVVDFIIKLEDFKSSNEGEIFNFIIQINHVLDDWFRNNNFNYCIELLNNINIEKLDPHIIIGLLMNSIRGGKNLIETRNNYRIKLKPILENKIGNLRTQRILDTII